MRRGCRPWAVVFLVASLLGAAEPRVTPFWQDVAHVTHLGVDWLRDSTIYTDDERAPEAKALALTALLETADIDTDDPIRGYAGARSRDQHLARSTVQVILSHPTYGVARGGCRGGGAFDPYSEGRTLRALALYASTGGPDVENECRFTLRSAIDHVVDRVLASQAREGESAGFWGSSGTHGLSGATLFAATGLAAARDYYQRADSPRGSDLSAAGRLIAIDDALALAAAGYASSQNADGGEGDRVNTHHSSYQHTAAGLWVSLLGGAGLNESPVQGYLKWHYQNYNYETIDAAFGNGEESYYCYLWASAMAYTLLEEQGQAPDVGNVTTTDLGTLPSGAIRLDRVGNRLAAREPEKDPDARLASVGVQRSHGKYKADHSGWCYDYAYTLMRHQRPSGQFNNDGLRSAGPPASWTGDGSDPYLDQAYAILALKRAVSHCS